MNVPSTIQWHRSAQRLIDDLCSASDPRKPWAVAWLTVRSQPRPFARALIDLLGHQPSPREAAWASALILRLGEAAPRVGIDATEVSVANEHMHRLLNSANAEDSDTAARALLNLPLYTGLLPDLRRHLRRTSRSSSVCAAIVLARAGHSSMTVLRALQRGCGHHCSDIGHPAARLLAEAVADDAVVRGMFLEVLAAGSDDAAARAAAYVDLPGLPLRECAALLARRLRPSHEDSDAKAACALHFSRLGRHGLPFADALLPLLMSDHPHVVEGAATSIGRLRHQLSRAKDSLVRRLSTASGPIREALLNGLKHFPMTSDETSQVVNAVGLECSSDEVYALGSLLGTLGAPALSAIRALAAAVTIDDVRTIDPRAMAVLSIACTTLPTAVLSDLLVYARSTGSTTLQALLLTSPLYLRSDSKALEPVLAEWLEDEAVDDIATMILANIQAIGTLPPSGYNAVLRCLLLGSSRMCERAQAVLALAGPELDPVLESLRHDLADEARGRIEQLMVRRGSLGPQGSSPFLEFRNDTALQHLALVAHAMSELGVVSMPTISEYLERRQREGAIVPGIKLSDSSLRMSIKDIERHFAPLRITSRTAGRKGGLMPEAVRFLDDVMLYLRAQRIYPILDKHA